jgi:metal-responsive CopG/Arc/MetJ family transcriptional regulator
MHTMTRTPTTEMEVTSIRLERDLKEKLKELSGSQGYQALIRDILWNYVQHRSSESPPLISSAEIRATFSAIAQTEEQCVLTGKAIHPQQPMLLGLTTNGLLVPLSSDSITRQK